MSPVDEPVPDDRDARLPGDQLVPALRARARELALREAPASADPTARIADVLHLWSAFDRNWLARLLPVAVSIAEADGADAAPKAGPADLDPRTADDAKHRLQVVWTEVVEELVERGRRLNGADFLPFGIEELMGEVYLVAARHWPQFVYIDREHTLRWLLSILHNLLRQAVHRGHVDDVVPLPDDPAQAPATDGTATQATRSRAEERELMSARVLVLHGKLPAECHAPDLPDRLVAQSTLQLFVAADTLETALRLSPEDCRLWGLLAVRQMASGEAARCFNIKVNALTVRFHRLRSSAIGLLAECWAAAGPNRS